LPVKPALMEASMASRMKAMSMASLCMASASRC
jgi:hypothetical protein